MDQNDKYLVQLRRELTRRQAQLGKAESQRDRLLEQNRKLRKLIEDNGVKLPARLRWLSALPSWAWRRVSSRRSCTRYLSFRSMLAA